MEVGIAWPYKGFSDVHTQEHGTCHPLHRSIIDD